MALWAALRWAGISTALRIVLGFFSAKVSAVYLGPPGMALVGQVNNFLQVATGAIANGASTAIVNLTAVHGSDSEHLGRLWGTAMRLVLGVAALAAVLTAVAAVRLSAWLLLTASYWPVLLLAAVAMLMAVADNVILGAMNGLKRVRLVASAGIASAIVEFCVFAGFTYLFGLWGGLLGIVIVYGTKLGVSSTVAFRSGVLAPRTLIGHFDRGIAREIGHFYPMLLAQSIALPLGQILVRNAMIRGFDLEQAGYLQATWRLSDMYVGVLTTALGLYFMAHYSALPTERERGIVLRRTIGQMLVFTAAAAIGIYLLRDLIIRVVLTRRFAPMADLLPFQLLGDVFKMVDYPLQMALVSQRRVRAYIVQAVGGPASYVVLTYVWRPVLGLQAAPAAYAASYVLALVVLLTALRATLGISSPKAGALHR
jgi:PST family polysaccharide transporter